MVTNTYAPARNGVAAVVHMLRRELRARGHEVEVLTSRLAGREPDDGVHEVPAVPGLAPDYPWPMAGLGIPRSLRGRSFDLVHVHHPVLLGRQGKWLAEACGAASVFTAHSVYTDYLDSYARGMLRPLKPRVARTTTAFLDGFGLVLAPSTHVSRTLREWGVTARVAMLENAGDVAPAGRAQARRTLGLREDVPVAVDVGRLAPEKRHDVVLREFAAARTLVPAAQLVIIGEGHQRGRLLRLASELGVEGAVTLRGAVDRAELGDWYAAADVLVQASLSETGPLTVVEAMTCGTPTVAYDAPGYEDRVATGDNGILVDLFITLDNTSLYIWVTSE
jgi:glycosyltransferase involved in cell wall biosynthesis